jgi:hypothetical protein
MVPAEAQQRVSPLGSQIVMIVLLNVAMMFATARGTSLRIRLDFFGAGASAGAPAAGVAGAGVAGGAAAGFFSWGSSAILV